MRHGIVAALVLNLIFGAHPTWAAPEARRPLSNAATVVSVDLPAAVDHPAATLTVTEIPASEQAEIVRDLAWRDSGNVVFLTANGNDPVQDQLDGERHLIVSADRPEDAPLFDGPEGQKEIEKLRPLVEAKRSRLKQAAPALLIALVPASGYGTYFFLLTSDYMQTAGGFTWEFLMTAGIGLYSKGWLKFSHGVGDLVQFGALAVASRFGRITSPLAQKRWHRSGIVLAAYGLNLVSSFMLMGIGHHLNDWHADAFAFLFAMFASHEVLDYHSEHLVPESKLSSAIWARQALFSMVEIVILSGVPYTEYFAGGVVGTAVVSYIFQEQTAAVLKPVHKFLKKLDPRPLLGIRKKMLEAEPILQIEDCAERLKSKHAS